MSDNIFRVLALSIMAVLLAGATVLVTGPGQDAKEDVASIDAHVQEQLAEVRDQVALTAELIKLTG